jgi:hypothetical protein
MAGDGGREAAHGELAAVSAPRLRAMVGHLHGHHEIEDYHYFPTFREEPACASLRSARERSRCCIDIACAGALSELIAAADASAWGSTQHAADRYLRESDMLTGG